MTERTPSPIDRLCDDFVQAYCILNPTLATMVGIPGGEQKMPDYSPGAADNVAQLERDFIAAVQAEDPLDDVDRVTQAAVAERHGLSLELHDAGENLRNLNVISSPVQDLRDIFDLMPTQTEEHWQNIAARMKAIPASLESYREALSLGASRTMVPASRQIGEVVQQIDALADRDSSFFTSLAANAALGEGELSAALRTELEEGAADARQAYADLGAFLTQELAPIAPEQEGVGRERYQRFSRYFLGAEVDLDETYEWGREILAEIVAEQEAVASELYGAGTTPEEAIERLNADPSRQIHGTAALQKWMQQTADQAIADLNGTHFDIPEPVQTLECRIAPTQTGGIYYTPPNSDFSRPGRMWWSVPAGVDTFGTWTEKTTVYHEGVPGHHLQLGQTAYRTALLNMWRRTVSWVSGHGEGWALYAERLMQDLGYLSDPGDRMGMLDAQRLRAARVVLDIGVHLGKPLPAELGSGTWDRASAWKFLCANSSMERKALAFELNRYLGWPGQAPSYKVGQRLWEQIRDDASAAAAARGEDFDLKAFHRRALDVGSVGLDTLRRALAE